MQANIYLSRQAKNISKYELLIWIYLGGKEKERTGYHGVWHWSRGRKV